MSPAAQVNLVVIGVVLLVLALPVYGVFWSCMQARVYRRQGIEITWWEVALGARPAAPTGTHIKGR